VTGLMQFQVKMCLNLYITGINRHEVGYFGYLASLLLAPEPTASWHCRY